MSVSLYAGSPSVTFNRAPTAIEEFAAAMQGVMSGRTPSISPITARVERDARLKEIMDTSDDYSSKRANSLLNEFILNTERMPNSLVAQNIPVGKDPNLPMDQDQFRDWVNRQRDMRTRSMEDALAPYGGSILELIRRNNMMRGV
jgi:hypothetical protein